MQFLFSSKGNSKPAAVVLSLLGLVAAWATGVIGNGLPLRGPILPANPSYDTRTEIRPSAIPGGGNGLYARVRIAKGETIGELGGQLLIDLDVSNPSWYVAELPDCAHSQVPPYRYIDSQDHGGHVSRINFAPRRINGQDTGFQNAVIERVCHKPYVIFVALRDIEPGEEMWSSYGPDYNYEKFMYEAKVRDFFCARAKIDCREKYGFEH